MKILLDECIPPNVNGSLPNDGCPTLPEAGLAGRKNGFLLDLAEQAGFEIFVTMDRRLEYQQNLEGRSIAILILRGKSNRLAGLLSFVSDLLGARKLARKGETRRIAGGEPVC